MAWFISCMPAGTLALCLYFFNTNSLARRLSVILCFDVGGIGACGFCCGPSMKAIWRTGAMRKT